MINNRILIVDDSESIHRDIKAILVSSATENEELNKYAEILFGKDKSSPRKQRHKQEYQIEDAYQGEDAVVLVEKAFKERKPYALAFMDVRMPPGIDGIETISRIWAIDKSIEIVICTAYSDYSWDSILDTLGESDKLLFLQKPFNSVEIKQIVLSLTKKWALTKENLKMIEEQAATITEKTAQLELTIKELESKNKLLAKLSQIDSLTGLLNYRTFHRFLKAVLGDRARQMLPICICMVDVDYFKQFNDNYGHPAGDEILRQVSSIFAENLRSFDIISRVTTITSDEDEEILEIIENCFVGRYGGDEFIITILYCDEQKARTILERLLGDIRSIKIEGIDSQITASFGAAIFKDVAGREIKELISLADQSLYRAKEKGRNQVHIELY